MAKSKDKKKKDNGSNAADQVRGAVEQALGAAFGSAAAITTRERAQELVDDIGAATARVRATIDELNVLDDLKALRAELERLNARVDALEKGEATPARASSGTKPAGTRSRSAASARKSPTTRKAPAKASTRSSGSTPPRSAASARKAPATGGSGTRRAAATKPSGTSSTGRS